MNPPKFIVGSNAAMTAVSSKGSTLVSVVNDGPNRTP